MEEYEAQHGGPLYKTNPDQCCFDRKVTVLDGRSSACTPGPAPFVAIKARTEPRSRSWAGTRSLAWSKSVRLANWTKSNVWKLITDHDIPYNPLHDQGYTSIGCWPCTRAVMFGEDERAGRWSGFAKTECGLHSLDDNK